MGRKSTIIDLSAEDREYLEAQTRARTIQAQTVNRARILLLKADGCSINDIADKVGINRKSVMLCLNKYAEGGVENALFDAPGRGRNAEITDDEKAWIINIVLNSHHTSIKMLKQPAMQGFLLSIKVQCTAYWTKLKLSLFG